MGTTLSLPWTAGALGSAYVATSLYFLHNPLSKHLRKPVIPRVRFIAHRGGAGEGYENTCGAYSRAVSCGAEMLELDVHLTRDQQVVVSHDQNLGRVTGVDKNIRDLDYDEIPAIKHTVNIDFDPGEVFTDDTVAESERVLPRLREVLTQFPETQINIDVKVKDAGLVEAVNTVILDNHAEKRCVWGSFSDETTRRCYNINPDIGILFSMREVVKLYIMFYLGLLPFISIKQTHLELPLPSIFLNQRFRSRDGNVGIARISPWIIRTLDWLLMSPALFHHLDQRGVTVYLWVLNTEDQYQRALDLGVHGVMTDYPTKLQNFLDKKNN